MCMCVCERLRQNTKVKGFAFHFMHIFNHISFWLCPAFPFKSGEVLIEWVVLLWVQLSDDCWWQMSSTTLLALLSDRPSVPFSSLPEWTWGLTRRYKTNNTSARPSLFPATRQLTFHFTVANVVTDSASLLLPLPLHVLLECYKSCHNVHGY